MSVYERGETFVHRLTIRDRDKTKVNPTAVTETIYDPCNYAIISAQSMSSDATGEYYYNHNLSSSATYGRYRTHVEATSGTLKSTFEGDFYVMPWKLEQQVRTLSGVGDEKSISDSDLSHIVWMAYKRALRDVYEHHYRESPGGNPNTGVGFDGTNTAFKTHHYPIADINGDGSVTGNNVSCATDVKTWWINSSGARQIGVVTIGNKDNGEINIYQSNGSSAIPNTNEGVYLDYWSEYDSFDSYLLEEAVTYLACHYVNLRFTEKDRVTVADLERRVLIAEPNRFYNEYRRLLKFITKPRLGVA